MIPIKPISEIRLASANVNGLNNGRKRSEIMVNLEKSAPDIILLSDTRFDVSSELLFRNEIDYNCYFNSYDSRSRGVAILVRKTFPLTILDNKSDDNGNLLSIKCEYDKKVMSITAIYGPNRDEPAYFENLFDILGDWNTDMSIIGGDFNVTLSHELDNLNYVNSCNNNARRKLNNLIESNNFLDPYRLLNGEKREYTWTKWGRTQHARLDYFLISDSLTPYIRNFFMLPKIKSDHNPIILCIDFDKFKHGKGLWNFDTKLLKDPDYIKCVKKNILDTCARYVQTPNYLNFFQECTDLEYNIFSNNTPETLQNLEFNINPNLFIEVILNDLKNCTISYVAAMKRHDILKEKELLGEIVKLQLESYEAGGNADLTTLNNKHREYTDIIQKRADNSIFLRTSRMKIEGEKPTSFFCKLEKNLGHQKIHL